jgi:hypothetical protein
LGLLLRHAEHSVVPDGARAHPDGSLDEQGPEVEVLDQLRSDVVPSGLYASDAWDGAHRDGAADAAHQTPVAPEDGDAERSADPVPGGPARDASFPAEVRHGRLEVARPDAAAPYTPDEAPSAERSCAAQDFVLWAAPLVASDAERSELPLARAEPKP